MFACGRHAAMGSSDKDETVARFARISGSVRLRQQPAFCGRPTESLLCDPIDEFLMRPVGHVFGRDRDDLRSPSGIAVNGISLTIKSADQLRPETALDPSLNRPRSTNWRAELRRTSSRPTERYCLFLSIVTRKKVAMRPAAALMLPRRLPVTFDCPPLRQR